MADATPSNPEVTVATPAKEAPKPAPKPGKKENPKGRKVTRFGVTMWLKD